MSVDNAPLSVADGPLSVDDGPLSVDNAPLSVADGPLSVDNAPLSVADDPMSVDNGPFPVALSVGKTAFMDRKPLLGIPWLGQALFLIPPGKPVVARISSHGAAGELLGKGDAFCMHIRFPNLSEPSGWTKDTQAFFRHTAAWLAR